VLSPTWRRNAETDQLGDYRVIDADIIKDYLIEQALDDGIYDHLLAEILADRHTLAPHELSARSWAGVRR
jgi:hypothetical protein